MASELSPEQFLDLHSPSAPAEQTRSERGSSLRKRKHIIDDFSIPDTPVDGEFRIEFRGWKELFYGDTSPEIHMHGDQVYATYRNCRLGCDLTSICAYLKKDVGLDRVTVNLVYGDAVIKAPFSRELVRITIRETTLEARRESHAGFVSRRTRDVKSRAS